MSEKEHGSIGGGEFLPDARTLVFRGINGIECEQFVRSVRVIALTEGKEEDDRWMLHFATARLSGNALRWHARLDKEIRRDWDLLVQAMLDTYPVYHAEELPDAIVSATPMVTPAEASSQASAISAVSSPPQRSVLSPGLNVGRLRIVPNSGHARALYVCNDLEMTTAPADALHVQFLQSSEPHRIGIIRWKPVTYQGPLIAPDAGYLLGVSGSNEPIDLQMVAISGLADAYWQVGPDGVVGISYAVPLSDPPTPNFQSRTLIADMRSQSLRFVLDPMSWIQSKGFGHLGIYYEAQLVFEPLSEAD